MSKDFKSWLKYKHDICSRNYKKQDAKWRNKEITAEEYCDSVNKYYPPLMDLYRTLNNVLMSQTWSSNYEEMRRRGQAQALLLPIYSRIAGGSCL